MRNILVLGCVLFLFIACTPQTYSTRPTEIIKNQQTIPTQQTNSPNLSTVQTQLVLPTTIGSCTDTDSGNDQTKKGTLTLKTQDNTTIVEDTCINKEILLEQYCKLGQKFTDKILCEKNCKEGACL